MSWKECVNQPAASASVADVRTYLVEVSGSVVAPIDTFYGASQELLKVGTPSFLAGHPGMGALLLVGLVSVTENYFRDILSGIVRVCPLSRAHCADEKVMMGSVAWHAALGVERGAFEHVSFAGSKAILNTSDKFIDYKPKLSSIGAEFDKVCELRHGIVHSSAVLAGKNAVKLQLAAATKPLKIVVGVTELQEAAAICTSLVLSVNQELFAELCRRWVKEWPKTPSWRVARANEQFRRVWTLFYSRTDALNATILNAMSMAKCRSAVLKQYT